MYLVKEFVDGDYQIVNTKDYAEEIANHFKSRMIDYAKDNREWPKGSRVIIAKIIKDEQIEYNEKEDFYEMKTKVDKLEEVKQ